MIDLTNLSKKYPGKKIDVLSDLNFTIPDRSKVAVVGGTGSGKSTLLRILSGVELPTSGSVNRTESVSWPIGSAGGFNNQMSARQNAKFIAEIYGQTHRMRQIEDYLLDFTELAEAFDRPLKSYSFGMKAKFAFGLSLAIDFDVYLTDSNIGVGEVSFREKSLEALKERVAEKGIIMTSHSEFTLKQMCESVIYLKDGKAVWYDDFEEGMHEYRKNTTA